MRKLTNSKNSNTAVVAALFLAFTAILFSFTPQAVHAGSDDEVILLSQNTIPISEGAKTTNTMSEADYDAIYNGPLEPEFFAGGDGVGGL